MVGSSSLNKGTVHLGSQDILHTVISYMHLGAFNTQKLWGFCRLSIGTYNIMANQIVLEVPPMSSCIIHVV